MADILKLQATDGIFDYPDSGDTSKGTTEQQYIEWTKNHHTVLESAIRVSLWQPDTDYTVGMVVSSPNMEGNTVARVTTAGHSSAAEPAWPSVGNAISDGSVTWIIVPRTLDFATDSEIAAGTEAGKLVSPATLKNIMDTKLAPKANAADVDTLLAQKLDVTGLTPNMLFDTLHKYGNNYKPSDVTNAGWGALGTFISFYTSKVLANQPSQYGQLINLSANGASEATQLWLDQPSGRLAYRGGNGGIVMNDTAFTYVARATDLQSLGVAAGNVSSASAWWVKLSGTIPLIIQGGLSTAQKTVTLPVACSNVLLTVVGSSIADLHEGVNTRDYTKTSFYLYLKYAYQCHWLAIGY